jgi:uncharacterized RDD family membrane protein YckC
MLCQHCNRQSLPEARFCHLCGRPIEPQCRFCNTVNPQGSNFCYSCGNRLAEEQTAHTEHQPAPGTAAGLVCPRCNQRNEAGSTYCFACGMPLDEQDVAGAAPTAAAAWQIPAYALGQPGGFWVRLLAYVMDAVILTVAFSIVWVLFTGQTIADYLEPTETITTAEVYRFVVEMLYFTIAIAVWSTTLGKRPFRLYVVRSDGSRVSPLRSAARFFAYFLSLLILGIGFIMIGVRQDKRGLHDLICDTVVIRR